MKRMAVKLQVDTINRYDTDSEPDVLSIQTEGVLGELSGKKVLRYVYDDTITVIHIESDEVSITRKIGDSSNQIVCSRKNITYSDYKTLYGNMPMQVHTKSLNVIEDNKELKIKLKYHIYLNGMLASDNEVNIIVTK